MRSSMKLFVVAAHIAATIAVFSVPSQAADLPVPPRAVALPLEANRLADAQSRLAFGLLRELEQSLPRGTNVAISPASIAATLALLDLGADARMQAAIYRTLGFVPRSNRSAAIDLARLRAIVARLRAQENTSPLMIGDALLFDPTTKPNSRALEQLRSAGTNASVEDLSRPDALKRINDWVATRTKGMIPAILEQMPRDAGMVALNALYFKDRWHTAFDPKATRTTPFRVLNSEPTEVPMMRHTEGRFRFRQDDRFIAVDLPYGTDGYSLTVITAKREPLPARAFAPAASWLAGAGFAEAPGEVGLPRFTLSGNADLLGPLDALGLKTGRLSPTALAGFSTISQAIARVAQRTVLRVDEAGTEAAAATAVTTTRSAPADFVKILVDKPFVVALRHERTGMIMVAGYVSKPTPADTGAGP
jgi:serine protease inhibitor